MSLEIDIERFLRHMKGFLFLFFVLSIFFTHLIFLFLFFAFMLSRKQAMELRVQFLSRNFFPTQIHKK